jgi:hypothetical protein
VDGRDRKQLERLCRYITRPPIAQDRLTRRADGSLELELKSVWKDGTRAIVLEPDDLLTRLVAAVPPPRQHQLRYFGVLSSHAKLRAEVVPCPDAADADCATGNAAQGGQLELVFSEGPDAEERDDDDARPSRKPWAWLLRHVFQADLEHCPRCNGAMRWVHAATAPKDIARLLAEHGLGARAPPRPMSSPSGQLRLAFPLSS